MQVHTTIYVRDTYEVILITVVMKPVHVLSATRTYAI